MSLFISVLLLSVPYLSNQMTPYRRKTLTGTEKEEKSIENTLNGLVVNRPEKGSSKSVSKMT